MASFKAILRVIWGLLIQVSCSPFLLSSTLQPMACLTSWWQHSHIPSIQAQGWYFCRRSLLEHTTAHRYGAQKHTLTLNPPFNLQVHPEWTETHTRHIVRFTWMHWLSLRVFIHRERASSFFAKTYKGPSSYTIYENVLGNIVKIQFVSFHMLPSSVNGASLIISWLTSAPLLTEAASECEKLFHFTNLHFHTLEDFSSWSPGRKHVNSLFFWLFYSLLKLWNFKFCK